MRSGRLGLQYGIPRGAIGGRGTSETTAKPKRGKPSLVESYVTPSPGVGWLQACGRTTPVKRPFHPTRHWHCLSKPSPRFQVSTLTDEVTSQVPTGSHHPGLVTLRKDTRASY